MATTTSNLQALAAAWGVGNEYQPIVVDLRFNPCFNG